MRKNVAGFESNTLVQRNEVDLEQFSSVLCRVLRGKPPTFYHDQGPRTIRLDHEMLPGRRGGKVYPTVVLQLSHQCPCTTPHPICGRGGREGVGLFK